MNGPIAFISVWFFIIQNVYFGWNAHAMSDAEIIVDGISCILVALAFVGRKA